MNSILGSLSQATGDAGEQVVARELVAKGFSRVLVDTRGPGATDVVGHRAGGGGVLVQVKSCGALGVPAMLSASERQAICTRARSMGYEAWYAAVTMGLLPKVTWERLDT